MIGMPLCLTYSIPAPLGTFGTELTWNNLTHPRSHILIQSLQAPTNGSWIHGCHAYGTPQPRCCDREIIIVSTDVNGLEPVTKEFHRSMVIALHIFAPNCGFEGLPHFGDMRYVLRCSVFRGRRSTKHLTFRCPGSVSRIWQITS